MDHVVRLGRVRTVDGDDVHPAEHCVQRWPPRRLQRLLDRFRQTLAALVMDRKAAGAGARCERLSVSSHADDAKPLRSEEHTSELQSLMRISYAVFCLNLKNPSHTHEIA